MANVADAPWISGISAELKNNPYFKLRIVAKYFKLPVIPKGKTGVCCNCERVRSIQCSGLCNACYQATKGKAGVELLNALTAARARLYSDVKSINQGEIGGETAPFEQPKIIKTIPVTDPKYVQQPVAKESSDKAGTENETYQTNVADGKEAPECITPTDVHCNNVFLVDDVSDPEEMNVVGPLDNPDVVKKSVLRSEAAEQIEESEEKECEVVSEYYPPITVRPIIKKSVVIEFGDAEIQFRIGPETVDIRVEDGGDLIFLARDVDKSILGSIAALG